MKTIPPQNHKAEHKRHKNSFWLWSLISNCFAPSVTFCVFVVKEIFSSAQSIVGPNTSAQNGAKIGWRAERK
jgi:hypothetical protein